MSGPTGKAQRSLVVAVAAATVLVAGCSEQPSRAGSVPPKKPSPSTTTASPTPQTPEEEIEAAVRAYYEELTRAAQTNDTSRLKTMSTKGCPCYGYVRVIRQLKRDNRSARGATWTITDLRVHDRQGDIALAEVKYEVSAYEVVNREGKVVKRYPPQRGHVDLSMVRGEGGWIIGNSFNLES